MSMHGPGGGGGALHRVLEEIAHIQAHVLLAIRRGDCHVPAIWYQIKLLQLSEILKLHLERASQLPHHTQSRHHHPMTAAPWLYTEQQERAYTSPACTTRKPTLYRHHRNREAAGIRVQSAGKQPSGRLSQPERVPKQARTLATSTVRHQDMTGIIRRHRVSAPAHSLASCTRRAGSGRPV